MNQIKTFLIIWLSLASSLNAFTLFGPSTPPTAEEIITSLKEKQADYPNDPEINYNLGVAYFRNNQLPEAITNFGRSLEYAGNQKEFRNRCLFNLGNCYYKNTLAMLPENWDNKETTIEPEPLEKAIAEAQQSIDHYNKLLAIDPQHTRANNNLKPAEELKKKLEEKRKKQQQDKKKNKDQNKDQKQNQDQKDQQKQQDKQQQDKQQQDNKQNKQPSSDKQQEKDGKQGDDKNQREQERPDGSQKPSQKPEQGKPDNKDQKNNANNGQQPDNHQKPPEQKPEQPEKQGKQEAQEKQESGASAQEKAGQQQEAAQAKQGDSQEMRGIRALLDNLQADEANAQKALMMEKMKRIAPQKQKDTQKPW